MKATFEAHRRGIWGLEQCDKLGTATIVTVLGNSNPVPKFKDKLVTCADDALISEVGHLESDEESKGPAEAELPDLSKDANLTLRRMEEAKLLGHFCSLVLNRLRDCESRTKEKEWKQIIDDYNNGKLVPEL
jgi:hypothetical protein